MDHGDGKKQEARSKKQESKKQIARSKKQEARSKKRLIHTIAQTHTYSTMNNQLMPRIVALVAVQTENNSACVALVSPPTYVLLAEPARHAVTNRIADCILQQRRGNVVAQGLPHSVQAMLE